MDRRDMLKIMGLAFGSLLLGINPLSASTPNERKVYRGQCHVHTNNPDGLLTIYEVAELYKAKGYDFIFVTDHDKINRPTRPTAIPVFSGVEVSYLKLNGNKVHILGLGVTVLPQSETIEGVLAEISDQRGISFLCHPAQSKNQPSDYVDFMFDGVEVYNAYPFNDSRMDTKMVDGKEYYEAIHRKNPKRTLLKLYSDDTHKGNMVGRTYTDVYLPIGAVFNQENVLNAIRTNSMNGGVLYKK